jgi:hypothetical protein
MADNLRQTTTRPAVHEHQRLYYLVLKMAKQIEAALVNALPVNSELETRRSMTRACVQYLDGTYSD